MNQLKETNTNQINAKTKEISKLDENNFANFYLLDQILLKDYKFILFYMYYEIKYNISKKYRLIARENYFNTNYLNMSSSIVQNTSIYLLLLIVVANNFNIARVDIKNTYLDT